MTRIRPTTPVTRRSLLAGTIAGAAALRHSDDATAAPSRPRTFVLVHGAWHGGWCWRRVSDRLHQHGHAVFTPTLTGLGERSHSWITASCSKRTPGTSSTSWRGRI